MLAAWAGEPGAGDVRLSISGQGREQGYSLVVAADAPVHVQGVDELGLMYGLMTLAEMIETEGGGLRAPQGRVDDWPDFNHRGTSWLIWAECGVWSLDRGDGLAAFKARALRKLDHCLRHKLNLVACDGFGWDAEKFPGYSQLMRELNREARRRGVRLLFGGYTSGYGASARGLYRGQVFKNRKSYPDGETYPCVGLNDGRGRDMATCLSNPALMDLKIQELAAFVRAVEPGALYLHNIDVWSVSGCEQIWKNRCAACRILWPDDDVRSPRGMAGAYARFYERLAEAVNAVEAPGYRPERDCLPAHGRARLHRAPGRRRRMDEVARILGGRQLQHEAHRQCEVHFPGAVLRPGLQDAAVAPDDRRFASPPVGGDRLPRRGRRAQRQLLPLQSGLERRLQGRGRADDQLRPCLPGAAGALQRRMRLERFPPAISGESSLNLYYLQPAFAAYKNSAVYPKAVFGPEGFLRRACRSLYGKRGDAMWRLFSLRGENQECPVPYIWNMWLGVTPFQAGN